MPLPISVLDLTDISGAKQSKRFSSEQPKARAKPLQHLWGSQGGGTLQAWVGCRSFALFYFVLIKMRSLPYGNTLQHILVKI